MSGLIEAHDPMTRYMQTLLAAEARRVSTLKATSAQATLTARMAWVALMPGSISTWAIKNPNEQPALLQRRIDRCYTDHLDGKIEPDEWESRTAAWKAEQYELRQELSAHDRADLKYIQEGVKMLEIASRVHELFTTVLTPAEKREIVALVISNPVIKDGSAGYEYKKPFALTVNVKGFENWLGN